MPEMLVLLGHYSPAAGKHLGQLGLFGPEEKNLIP